MPKPDPLARNLIKACQELQRRRTWERAREDAPFLLRVPTEEEPLAGVLLHPEEGTGMVIFLACGENALDDLYQCLLRPDLEEDRTNELDLLCVAFERLGELPDDLRRTFELAGLQARREVVVPCPFSHPNHREPHPPGRRETKTLLWCLGALFAAEDEGVLQPVPVHPDTPVLELEVTGTLRAPELKASYVPWTASARPEGAAPVLLPPDVAELPQTDERWLALTPLLPGHPEGDGRRYRAFALVDEESGELLRVHALAEKDNESLVDPLKAVMRDRGRPRELVFCDAILHQALEPGLITAGVAVAHEPFHPAFHTARDAALAEHRRAIREGPAWVAPTTREDWEYLEDELDAWLSLRVTAEGPGTPATVERYFGDAEDPNGSLRTATERDAYQAYVEWLVADHRDVESGRTWLEGCLASADLDPADRTLLEARRDARVSLFRIGGLVGGEEDDDRVLWDAFTSEEYVVDGSSVDLEDSDEMYIPLRLLRVRETVVPQIAGPLIGSFEVDAVLAHLESLGMERTAEGVRRDAHLFGRLWAWRRERDEELPEAE